MKFIIRMQSIRETEDRKYMYTHALDKVFLKELSYEDALAKIEQIYIDDAQAHSNYIKRCKGKGIIKWEVLVSLMPRPENLKVKSVWINTENLKEYIG